MKPLLFLTALLFSCFYSFGQGVYPGSNTIYYNAGNVGMGTATPSAKLDIFNNASVGSNLILSAEYIDSYRWRFNTIDRGNAISMDITASDNADVQQTIFKLATTFSGRPSFALLDNWLVSRNGFIGIGTDQPASKLDI